MYGAILGDMIGSPFEFDRGSKFTEFEMFTTHSVYTDDTVMSIAVAEALMKAGKNTTIQKVKWLVVDSMRRWGRKYPHAGYGRRFRYWLVEEEPKPYGSYGNGSAMRVSSVGWLYDSLERTREIARATAEVTHNHPEGVKGAESVASAIFMARTGSSKEEIKAYVIDNFHYDFNRACDEIRPTYHHVASCQETVPEAFTAFFEGNSFEDVVRLAVSLGGDCDTLTCIASGIAEAYYGVPDDMMSECRNRLPKDMLHVLDEFLEAVADMEHIDGVILNPWDKFFLLDKELIKVMMDANKETKPENHICFDVGDITKLNCECIVNAANKSLLGGGGVDGAIHRAAGKELLEECRTLHGCGTGEAKITKGYHLKADYVIHTVGPIYSGSEQDEIDLENCYRNSLELAKSYGIHSIAFPAIGAGVYGYPLEEAIPIAIYTVTGWFAENKDYGMEVVYSCFEQDAFDMFQSFIELVKKGDR